MNLSVIIPLSMLYFITFYSFYQEGMSMPTIIAAGIALFGTVFAILVKLFRGRSDEKKEHSDLSKGHESIFSAQKECTAHLEKVTKEQVGILEKKQTEFQTDLKKLSEESIRMSETQKQVKERGIDIEKMIANIQVLAQMNAGNASQIQQLTTEVQSLRQKEEWLQSRVRELEEQIKEKDRTIWELQRPSRDEPDWDFDR